MNDLSEVVALLLADMETLKRRVSALEDSSRGRLPVPQQPLHAAAALPVAATLSVKPQAGAFSVLGKAMLAVAGAYLLRALAESAALPRDLVIVAAIAYAFLWLVPAVRAPAKAWFASLAWAGTSALILVPMLWELTLRFRILPIAVTAAILCAFVAAAFALAWKHHLTEAAWVSAGAAGIAALVLAIATRQLPPFIAALLFMTVAGEVAAACHPALRVRLLIAIVTDLGVFALIWIYSGPSGSRPDYPAVAVPTLLSFAPALLLLCASSATAQTILLRRGISFFEIAQALIAALLSVWSFLAFLPRHGPLLLGVLCLFASAAGYALTFARFDRIHSKRNYHVYATGSLALLIAGFFLCLPWGWLSLVPGFFALVAIAVGVLMPRFMLQWHALALLAACAFASGLFAYIFDALAGTFPGAPGWPVTLIGAFSVVCYAAAARSRVETSPALALRLLFAALALGATGAMLVWTLARLIAAIGVSGAAHFAVIRTLVACTAAIILAWCGSRSLRRELIWLSWAALGSIAIKLLVEDLRLGHLGFTASSIFLFAITLLLVPRLLRIQSKVSRGSS